MYDQNKHLQPQPALPIALNNSADGIVEDAQEKELYEQVNGV